MSKRKASEALGGLPSTLVQEPAGTSGTGPFTVHFPSRFDPTGDVACEWDAYAHSERRNQYVVVARTKSEVDFVGSTSNPEYSSALPCRYALGRFDRAAGTLEVMPAEGGRILRLEPRVRGQSYGPRGAATEVEQGALRDANMRLVEEFGSQRRKRQLKAREAGRVEAQHVSAGQAVLGLISGVGQAAGVSKAELIKSSLAQRNIPPHHPEATTAEEAYRSEEIVPPALRDALEVTKLFPAANKPDYRQQLNSSGMFGGGYVLTRLSLLAVPDKVLREERCRMLALLGHLLKLAQPRWGVLKAGPGGLQELAEKVKAAPSVLEGLLELFYSEEAGPFEGKKYLLSKDKRVLLLGWVLVLAVRVEAQCCLEPEHLQALAEELKVRPMDLVQRYRELGCVDVAVTATTPEGGRTRGYRITLMPPSAEQKTLGDYFPALKLGAKKR